MTTTAAPVASTGRIASAFQRNRAAGQIALMPFIPAGYPDMEATIASIRALADAGAAAIEVGIPFSDPIADGPTIQEAFAKALAQGTRLKDVFAAIREVRPRVDLPLVAMVSYSVVYRQGIQHFAQTARAAGFDGLILPDLPPPEAQSVTDTVRAAGLDTVLLVAPTTSPERRRQIADLSSGFIYYLSVAGITGERKELPPDIRQNLAQLKGLTDRPVCVGFGISTAEHLRQLQGHADGAIVGSAFVRQMSQHAAEGPEGVAAVVGAYCRDLLAGVR